MKTKKLHLWVGNFKTRKLFDKYLDQTEYLKAWAIYDHEAPTGNAEDDAEPNPEMRCAFCIETGLDTYEEDLMITEYYKGTVDSARIAADTLTDKGAIEKSLKEHELKNINAVIAYEDDELSAEDAAKCSSMQYLGKINQAGKITKSGSAAVHHLWMGEKETISKSIADLLNDKKNALKFFFTESGIDKSDVIKSYYHYSNAKQKLDEMIVIHIDDFNIAEKMILKADAMKLPESANLIIDLVVKPGLEIDGGKTAVTLGLKYIGGFDAE